MDEQTLSLSFARNFRDLKVEIVFDGMKKLETISLEIANAFFAFGTPSSTPTFNTPSANPILVLPL